MPTNYPSGLDSFTTHHDGVNEAILAADINKIQDAVAAIETTLGTNPTTAGGDLSGTLPAPTVAKVNGVAVSGTPSLAGQVLAATGTTAAAWSSAAVVVDGGNAASTFAPVPVGSSYMSTAQIAADPALTGTYVQTDTIGVDVRTKGATSSTTTNNRPQLLDSMDLAKVTYRPIVLPPGDWGISTPLPFRAGIIGSGPNCRIFPTSSFTGGYLIDHGDATAASVEFKVLKDITLDMGSRTIQALGSSGDFSGSANTLLERVQFINGSPTVYAVGGASTTNVGGMLTGATFLHCRWQNVPLWANIGSNQDDVTFINPRFIMTDGRTGPADAPLVLGGQNNNVLGAYMYCTPSSMGAGDKPIIKLGPCPVTIRGLFIEGGTNCDYTHLIYNSVAEVSARIDSIQFGMTSLTAFVALARATIGSATSTRSMLDIRNLVLAATSVPLVFEVNNIDGSGTKRISLAFDGVDEPTALLGFKSGGQSNGNRVQLEGRWRTGRYSHYVTASGGATMYLPLARANGATGDIQSAFVATSESTTSAGSYTDLATPGPAVTAAIGASGSALVMVSANIVTGAGAAYMSYAVSGASTVAASTANAVSASASSTNVGASRTSLITGLTPGNNTFTAKYMVDSGTGAFERRSIIVQPI